MKYVLYGLRGNEWTNIARGVLNEIDIDYEVNEEFRYSLLDDGTKGVPYILDGVAYVREFPTLCIFTGEKRYWFSGLEEIKDFCELRVEACS